MTLDIDRLLNPVSDASPAGEDVRSSETYEAISAEIEKLTSLSGSGPIDWGFIEQQGANLLATESKDFMLAAWVSAAWIERHGIEGLLAGLKLHAGLIDTYWQTAFPPLKRIRGRRNALSWWFERASEWLSAQTLPPLAAEIHDSMVEAASRIDQLLADNDPEAPALANFIRQLKSLDVINMTEATAPASATAEPPPPTPVTPVMSAAQAAVPVMKAAPADFTTVNSLDELIAALNPVTQQLGQLSTALMALDRFHPLAIEMGRFAARAALLQTPPSQGSITALTPPPVAIMDAFQVVCATGNAEGIIEFCESRILTFPFWLDLDRQSARGFGMLGEPGARMRHAVINNALSFIERLPGIELLSFQDGTPFANNETRQWLEECRSANSGAAPAEPVEQTLQEANSAFQNGAHQQALALYQSVVSGSNTGRNHFRARIALAELFMATQGDADPVPFVQPIADDCQTHHLARWEPELASKAWQVVLNACRQALAMPDVRDNTVKQEHYRQLQAMAIEQLARIDFQAAVRYSR